MKTRSLVAALAAAVCTFSAQAADFPLTLHADDDSRWYDFLADEFAELGRGSGGAYPWYSIAAETDPFAPAVYSATGGSDNVFPGGAVFTDVGVISYGGSGDGTHPITGLVLDLAPHVADDLGSLGVSYETLVSNVSGTVTVASGQVSAISASADIAFRYDGSFISPTFFPTYNGDLVIEGDRLEIFVHERFSFGHGYLEHAWDIRAGIEGVGGDDDTLFRSGFE